MQFACQVCEERMRTRLSKDKGKRRDGVLFSPVDHSVRHAYIPAGHGLGAGRRRITKLAGLRVDINHHPTRTALYPGAGSLDRLTLASGRVVGAVVAAACDGRERDECTEEQRGARCPDFCCRPDPVFHSALIAPAATGFDVDAVRDPTH